MKKTLFRGLLGAALTILVCLPAASRGKSPKKTREFTDADFRTEKILEALPIRATFLDEVSWDIPHQNWGVREWDADFRAMKNMGINTVVLIRAGLGRWIAAPFECLLESEEVYYPPVDLVEMFLTLADKYDMAFYFGMYDSGKYWDTGDMTWEVEDNKYVIDEVWENYGSKYKSFGGWYISGEISRATKGAIGAFHTLGKQCKDISNGLPTFISPWIDGKKAIMGTTKMTKEDAVSVQQHEKEWDEIFDGIHEVVDACAFQDGHIDYDELDAFFSVNKKLADKYGMQCWTNAESFDRDMPIRFLPIKFDKLRLKLEAAKRAGYDKAITFEFSHFMSPQSAYLQAGHLYDRYKEYFEIK